MTVLNIQYISLHKSSRLEGISVATRVMQTVCSLAESTYNKTNAQVNTNVYGLRSWLLDGSVETLQLWNLQTTRIKNKLLIITTTY